MEKVWFWLKKHTPNGKSVGHQNWKKWDCIKEGDEAKLP